MRIHDKATVLQTGPLLKPTHNWPEYGQPEHDALLHALKGPWGIGAPDIDAQEHELTNLMGLPRSWSAVGVANGTVAIQLILEALDVGYGHRVLVPGLTWQATAGAVLDTNAIPVLVDVDDQWTISADLVEQELASTVGTPDMPVAVIAVHLFDRAAPMRELFNLTRRYGIWLIEDCAHAQGAIVDDRPAGSWGVASSISRQFSKTRTSGEGGDIVTCVPLVEQRVRALRSCGRAADTTIDLDIAADPVVAHWRDQIKATDLCAVPVQSGNYRETAFTAAITRAQNERFATQHTARMQVLTELDLVLPRVPGIKIAHQPHVQVRPAYRLGLEYDPDAYADMDNQLFCEALAYLLATVPDANVASNYEPLNNSTFYKPLSKQRHRISDEYMHAVDPNQYRLTNARRIYQQSITVAHPVLAQPAIARILPDALELIHRRAEALVKAAM